MEKEIIALRDENKITKVTHDIKTRCEIINSIFEHLRNMGAIQDETSDERMKLYADEYNKFSVNTLKADIQQAFKEYSSETESDAISGTIKELAQEYIENLEIHQKIKRAKLPRKLKKWYKKNFKIYPVEIVMEISGGNK